MAGESLKGKKSNNPNGKPKGATSKKTAQWDVLGKHIVDTHADRFNTVLGSLDDVDFVNAYTKILSYFKPQLARTEVKDTTEDKPKTIIVVNNSKEQNDLDKFLNETD